MKSLIERNGAVATIAPSLREIPIEDNPAAFEFAEQLLAGKIDIVVFMTGVGAKALLEVLETRFSRSDIFTALEKTIVVVRGPKPTAVLRGWGVRIDYRAPEPNTWRDVYETLKKDVPLAERRIAIQEYGQPSTEFYAALQLEEATVLPVPVYRWALPEDIEPLRLAVHGTINGQFDLLMFTSAQQLNHVLEIADREGLKDHWKSKANETCLIASIGPTATSTLKADGFRVDFEPTHPNMGSLVKESLAGAEAILKQRDSNQ